MDIIGISTNPASSGAYALILREIDGNRRLPIIIGAFEAQAIALEMEGIRPPRPMTHDLLRSIIETFGCTVSDVTITELRDGTFYARIALDTPTNDEIDSRPSDAIALAVRFGVPIFVMSDVLNEAGFIQENDDENAPHRESGSEVHSKERTLIALQKELEQAIQQEEYEHAAQLRDDIRRIQNSD